MDDADPSACRDPDPDAARRPPRDPEGLEAARRLVLAHGWNATAYQIVNPGIERWFPPDGDAVVGWVRAGGYRVAAGDPVCAPERLGAVAWAFERDARAAGCRVCWFGADERLAEALAERGPADRLLLGAQPVWHPGAWRRRFEAKASLRAQRSRATNKGVAVERWPSDRATGHPELRRCLAEWLSTRGLPPLHFLVEPATLERLADRRVFVARQAGGGAVAAEGERVVGFLVASPVPARRGWLVEQVVRGHGAPNGTAELLIDRAVADLEAEGARWVTLGLAPLSTRPGLERSDPPRSVRSVLAAVEILGRRFYDFEGLEAFKDKFRPERWEPVWALEGSGGAGFAEIGLPALWAVTTAFAGESPWRFAGRVLARALDSRGR